VNVDTLVRDQQAAEPRFDHPPAEPEQPLARACDQCGAAMAPGQDWCLECGSAAPGRLGRRPGMRTAATVVGLTLALVAGAVTAGYAAINGDAGRDTAKPAAASGAPIAQAPPSTPAAPPPTTAAPATPTTPLPSVGAPAGVAGGSAPVTATPAPAASHPVAPAPATSAPVTSTPTTSTPTTSTPSTPAIEPIDLGADAASLYDPYTRSTASSDPADSYDGDTTTAWKVSTAGDTGEMEVGLVVDLGKKRSVKELKLHTGTPGFRLEAYAADTAQVPPDILDTRWAHLNSASGVAKDASIALAPDSHKYRYVLLWLAKPPKKGPTVKINELTILG